MRIRSRRRDVLGCAPAQLPDRSLLRRDITRPVEHRQTRFEEEFDATTLFYDVLALGGKRNHQLVLVGPPLRNLEPHVLGGLINGHALAPMIMQYRQRDRCFDLWLSTGSGGGSIDLSFDFGSFQLVPSRSELRRYAGRRVLYTLTKDNDLDWLADWARFHAVNHGADAVLLYDNGSTRYGATQLLATLRSALPGLLVDVVTWPFLYGPGGFSRTAGWDSDFCQMGAFQDARFRFLARARSVLNVDVDELVVSASGLSVFEATEHSDAGCLAFAGDWIASVSTGGDRGPSVRHGDFVHRELTQPERCPLKWCVVPAVIPPEVNWSTHHVRMPGFAESITDEFAYRHFRAISTDWKFQRSAQVPSDPLLHRVDRPLKAALDRAGLRRSSTDAFEDQA